LDLGQKILAGAKARQVTQTRLAEEAGISPEALSKIINGVTADPQLDTIVRIAHALGETVGSLLGEKGFDLDADDQQHLRSIIHWATAKLNAATRPLVDSTPNAVELSFVADSRKRAGAITGLIPIDGATRVFRASGDSMNDAGILHDDYLFVRPAGVSRMGAGKIVVCIVNGKTFVRKMEMSQRRIRLLSTNERYAPIEVARDDISFVGVVLGRMGAPRG
jgi:SOS-response transcriptional repressor LexA